MNFIINELGARVVAVGQERSFARMQVLYPRTMQMMIDKIKEKNKLDSELFDIADKNGVKVQDQTRLIDAAKFYESKK